MTVLNENEHDHKYSWLSFIEFQEMLCRIALVSVNSTEGIVTQVHLLVQLLYTQQYEQAIWNEEE